MLARTSTLFILTVALALTPSGPATADAYTTCLDEVARADLEAKTAYQKGLWDLIVAQRPEFSELAGINRDVQLLFAEMRFDRLKYLLSTAPERLDSRNGLSGFSNFNWTPEDLVNLRAARPEYNDKIARLEALKAQNQGHPDWPEMRAFVKSEMTGGGALAQLTEKLLGHREVMDSRLAGCQGK